MDRNTAGGPEIGDLDVGSAELGLAALLEACDRALEEVGATVPPAQLRALMVLGREGKLNLIGLARALNSSASATSRLIDRMEAAGLLTRSRAAGSRREIVLVPTASGQRLAEWVRGQRRDVLGHVLAAMSPDGREALARGLGELAAMSARPA